MRRVLVIAASSFALAACTGTDFPKMSMPSFDMPKMDMTPPAATSTVGFESEPAGAEVRTSTGQTCRTPCSLAVAAGEFSATFSAPGYQSQTIPVRMTSSSEGRDPMTGQVQPPMLSPNPVVAELAPAPPARRPAPATANPNPSKKKPKTTAKPKPAPAPAAAASDPSMATPAAPAQAWPMPAPAR